jgi:EAL domain-containing protein (putative c-di-GMP-specific phosphodiesterase class I)
VTVLESLAQAGIRFQLDDFGTGYSSLSHIRDFPVSGIKIDRSFVMDANVDEKSNALLHSVMGIARNLGFTVVAEGIESSEQLAFLKGLGCQYGQGYFFGKPLPGSAYDAILLNGKKRAA